MSGLQEILVIALIFAVIIFLPRLTGKNREKKSRKALQALSGKLRLALVFSVVWLLLWTVYFRPWAGGIPSFALVGLCPVILGWGALWVIDGFKRKRDV